MASGEGHDFVFFFVLFALVLGKGEEEEKEEEGVVINIQKEVGCNECSFCGFAFRKIDNDIRSPLFFLFLYISLLICLCT